MSINRVCVSGNLTRDPELRTTSGGMAILQLGIAVNDRRKENGEWTDVPNFFDAIVFGSRGESLSRHLSKGMKVAIEGKLRWSQWEDKKSGDKRSKVEIVVDDIEFLSRNEGNAKPAPDYDDETIPF